MTSLWEKVLSIMGDSFYKASWLHTLVFEGRRTNLCLFCVCLSSEAQFRPNADGCCGFSGPLLLTLLSLLPSSSLPTKVWFLFFIFYSAPLLFERTYLIFSFFLCPVTFLPSLTHCLSVTISFSYTKFYLMHIDYV